MPYTPPFTLPQAPGDWPKSQPLAPTNLVDEKFENTLKQGGTFYQRVSLVDPVAPTADPYTALVWEKPEGLSEAFSQQEYKLTRTFYVHPFDVRWFVAGYMIGWPKVAGALTGTGGIIRVPPQPYPTERFTSRDPLAHCHELVSCKGISPLGVAHEAVFPTGPDLRIGARAGRFLMAEMQFGYARLPHKVCRDDQVGWWDNGTAEAAGSWAAGVGAVEGMTLNRNIRVTPVPSGKHITFPAGAYKWEQANQPTGQTVGRMLQFLDLNLTWYDVPYVPAAAYTAPGKVNKRPIWGYKANQILVVGVDAQPHASITGQRLVDITYRLRYFRGDGNQSHNHFLRFGTNEVRWDRPVARFDFGAGLVNRYVFDEVEFFDLFRGPWETYLPL